MMDFYSSIAPTSANPVTDPGGPEIGDQIQHKSFIVNVMWLSKCSFVNRLGRSVAGPPPEPATLRRKGGWAWPNATPNGTRPNTYTQAFGIQYDCNPHPDLSLL